MKYLTDETSILDEYKDWQKNGNHLIFFNVPTGTGKTEFIKRYMIPLMMERNQKFIMFVNRVSLLEQIRKEFDEFFYEKFPTVQYSPPYEITTYQKLEVDTMHRQPVVSYLESFNYIICDEAHYFMTDSSFNPKTQFAFDSLVAVMPRLMIIMMSATMERVKPIVSSAYQQSFEKLQPGLFYSLHMKERTYDMAWDFSKYNFQYAVNLNELVKYIAFSAEKFLVFVPSITEGNKIKNMLEKIDSDIKIPMLTSEKKKQNGTYDNKIWHQIIEGYSFNCRILIATAVLDNGISLHDSKLRNIVILASTREEFLQMLGRCRLSDGEKLNVIVMCRKKTYYETKRDKEYLPLMKLYDDFQNNSDILNIMKVWNGERKIYERARRFSVFEPSQPGKQMLMLNTFSRYEFEYHYFEYKYIAEIFEYTDDLEVIYTEILKEWLGIKKIKLERIGLPEYNKCKELCDAFDMLLEKKLRKKEFQEKFNPLHNTMNKIYRLKNFKSNDNVTIKVLNDFFNATGLPYVAEREKHKSGVLYWIRRKDS